MVNKDFKLKGGVKEYLFFNKMITPILIQVIFWMLVLVAVIGGIGTMTTRFGGFFPGLMTIIGGILGARIACEMVLAIFQIQKDLRILTMLKTDGETSAVSSDNQDAKK